MANRNEFLKKISFRWLRFKLYNLICKTSTLSQKINLYNQTLDVNLIKGREIKRIENNNKTFFLVKEIEEVFVSVNTGLNMIKSEKGYKAISNYNGYLSSNYIKPNFKKKDLELNSTCINLVGIHKGHKHFYHFFFDYIFPLLFFLNSQTENIDLTILTRNDLTKFQIDTFNAISKKFKNIKFLHLEQNYFVRANRVIHIEFIKNHFYNHKINPEIEFILRNFRELIIKFYDLKEKNYNEKDLIYISRSKARLRKIFNEKKLLKYLLDKKFKIINSEDLEFKEQVYTFLNAKLIVGVHGAGFMNIIFSGKNLKFLEIYPKKFYDRSFANIAEILGFSRYEVISKNQFIWQSFIIDYNQITKAIGDLLIDIRSKN